MYTGLLAMATAGLAWVAMLVLIRRFTVIGEPLDTLPFQSGNAPAEHALSRFHVRWYLATLVFLAFDVEMLFMYPWALVVARLGAGAVIEMFVFLGALLLAVGWAWREGAFRWA